MTFYLSRRRNRIVDWFPLKEDLSEAQNHRCPFCGVRMGMDNNPNNFPTTEHVTPLRCGGRDHIDNVVIACAKCNRDRNREIYGVMCHTHPIKIAKREAELFSKAKLQIFDAPKVAKKKPIHQITEWVGTDGTITKIQRGITFTITPKPEK